MKIFLKYLQDHKYESPGDLICSLFPSFKYQLSIPVTSMSFLSTLTQMLFGLSWPAVFGLVAIMLFELVTGIVASRVRKEQFDSGRLKRFSFRFVQYFILLAVPYLLETSMKARESELAAGAFQWIQVFLMVQIVFENIISILENISVIDGKDKTHIINKIKQKLDSLF